MSLYGALFFGSLAAIGPFVGVEGAKYLGYSPLAGAAAGVLGMYAYSGNQGGLVPSVAAGAGAVYLPSYLPFGEGVLGTAAGAILGGAAGIGLSYYLMQPGKTSISKPAE